VNKFLAKYTAAQHKIGKPGRSIYSKLVPFDAQPAFRHAMSAKDFINASLSIWDAYSVFLRCQLAVSGLT
jgi:hypothetical protein